MDDHDMMLVMEEAIGKLRQQMEDVESSIGQISDIDCRIVDLEGEISDLKIRLEKLERGECNASGQTKK